MTQTAPQGQRKITTSKLDLGVARQRLARWLESRLGADERPTIENVSLPVSGMSSVSLMVDARWTSAGHSRNGSFVVRLEPEQSAVPLFDHYDLKRQFDLQRAVHGYPGVPVPAPLWHEPSTDVLGGEFYVMERKSGRVASDSPPYIFGGWLYDSPLATQERIQQETVKVIAAIHAIAGPALTVLAPEPCAGGEPPSLRRHLAQQREYYEWSRRGDGMRIPVLENAFDWVEQNWPAELSGDVLAWGDSRLGNIMFDGTEVAAVLDWENATIAPRELDVAWLIFFHRFYQDMADAAGLPGMPNLFRRRDVVDQYEALAGTTLKNLDFFLVYAALRHGIVMSQVKRRGLHFGETTPAAEPNDFVLHHRMLAELVDDTYDWDKK